MSDGFLSQEEIDSLLNGGMGGPPKSSPKVESSKEVEDYNKSAVFSDIEKDLLGEVGNISMGSASTALSQILNQPVNITTPVVTITTIENLRKGFEVPNIALDVKYISGIDGENLLLMKSSDANIIANLMMGGDGKNPTTELSEIEVSAVSEAMNQMIGSAATSMATMFAREVNISPPNCKIWDEKSENISEDINEKENVVLVSFKLTIGELIDSTIMQVLPIITARKIVSIMMGEESKPAEPKIEERKAAPSYMEPEPTVKYEERVYSEPKAEIPKKNVDVKEAAFQPLRDTSVQSVPKNIDLILDVPLEISVVLGRTKKSIKDILNLGTGSLIELDRLAEEPVEILVNGKKVAYGEVVVIDENFGVRVTNIISSDERIKSLSK